MLISCERCSVKYIVPADQIGSNGRKVKCASCAHIWFQEPPSQDELSKLEAIRKSQDDVIPRNKISTQSDKVQKSYSKSKVEKSESDENLSKFGKKSLEEELSKEPSEESSEEYDNFSEKLPVPYNIGKFYLTSIVMLILSVIAFTLTLVSLYPLLQNYEINKIYDMIGIKSSEGLALSGVKVIKNINNQESGNPVYYNISGSIVNLSDEFRKTPKLKIHITDAKMKKLTSWEIKLEENNIESGQTVDFNTGKLENKFHRAAYFVIDIGNKLELAIR